MPSVSSRAPTHRLGRAIPVPPAPATLGAHSRIPVGIQLLPHTPPQAQARVQHGAQQQRFSSRAGKAVACPHLRKCPWGMRKAWGHAHGDPGQCHVLAVSRSCGALLCPGALYALVLCRAAHWAVCGMAEQGEECLSCTSAFDANEALMVTISAGDLGLVCNPSGNAACPALCQQDGSVEPPGAAEQGLRSALGSGRGAPEHGCAGLTLCRGRTQPYAIIQELGQGVERGHPSGLGSRHSLVPALFITCDANASDLMPADGRAGRAVLLQRVWHLEHEWILGAFAEQGNNVPGELHPEHAAR